MISRHADVREDLSRIPAGDGEFANVLLVNDISRGGATLQAAFTFLEGQPGDAEIATATLLCQTTATHMPKFHAAITDHAVEFDWKKGVV